MIQKVELKDFYRVVVENDSEKQESRMGVEDFTLAFTSKQEVVDHIALLNKAIEFWEYEDCRDKEQEAEEMPIFKGTREQLNALGK